ncbi:MAG: hypothetical protein Kow0088_22420 [Anaerolineales bacterium]
MTAPIIPAGDGSKEKTYRILYHVSAHMVFHQNIPGNDCWNLNFQKFLDAGYVLPDGTDNVLFDLVGNPTSKVTSKREDRYFYISTPNDPLIETFGFSMFNWDVAGQALWSADYHSGQTEPLVPSTAEKFPADVVASLQNRFLLYPFTEFPASGQDPTTVILQNRMNPFLSDSSLVVLNRTNGETRTLLENQYNRQLFASFADFSADGRAFFTLARDGDHFKMVKIDLESGTVTDFRELFPAVDWNSLDWDAFFPRANDFLYASFTISPDETRLVIHKDYFVAKGENVCSIEAKHHRWVINLGNGEVQVSRDQPKSIVDTAWKSDSTTLALAMADHAGCYPGYIDASLELLDRDGKTLVTLVNAPKSKITTLGWSPDDRLIAYDLYGTDTIGRLNVVEPSSGQVREVINTQDLGFAVNEQNPILLLFADWVTSVE